MADNILIPGEIQKATWVETPTEFLRKNNYLSEFSGDEEIIRSNLGVYSKEEVTNEVTSKADIIAG
jgi:hypothetical protein